MKHIFPFFLCHQSSRSSSVCSHPFLWIEDGFPVLGEISNLKLTNSLQILHPLQLKRLQRALGGDFGLRIQKLWRLFPLSCCGPVTSTNESAEFRIWKLTCVKSWQEDVPAISPVEVIGVVRGSEKPSIFVPANDPASGQWFYVDVPAIAKACGLPEDTLYIEDVNDKVDPSNPYPIPKDSNTLICSSVMPQDHLNYILTWYVFSLSFSFSYGTSLYICYCGKNLPLLRYCFMHSCSWLSVSTFVFYIVQSTYGIHQILLMVFHLVV